MKKFLTICMMLVSVASFAQFSAGTSFVGVSSNSVTGLQFNTVEDSGVKNFRVGLEGGHFFADKLAAVAGLGYSNTYLKNVGTLDEAVSYKVGVKYYVENVFPVQVDFNGVDKTTYVGTQVGYAFVPSMNFSIEPNIRYDFATKKNYKDSFSFGVGFNYLF